MEQPIEKSAEQLIEKIELLSSEFKRLSAQLQIAKTENEKLKNEINSYKTEIQRLRDKQSRASVSGSDEVSIDTAEIQRELEMYIIELDDCIEKMKQL